MLKRKKRKKSDRYIENTDSKALLARADYLARKYCKRDGKCMMAGWMFPCGGMLNWAHIISRGNKLIRHDPDNAVCLCYDHHRYFHNRPREWESWVERTFPGRLDELRGMIKGHQVRGLDMIGHYETWIAYYEAKL